MEFLLLVWFDGSVQLAPDEAARVGPDALAWVDEMDASGARVHGSALAPPREAMTIRIRQGEATVTDGPAESKEYIAGFDVIQCADRNEAIEIASKHPVARFGRIELIPCLE